MAAAQKLGTMMRCVGASIRVADVMHVQDVDPVQAQPLKTILNRAHDRVIGEIEMLLERQRTVKAVDHRRRVSIGC